MMLGSDLGIGAGFINDFGTVIALGLLFAPFTYKTVLFIVGTAFQSRPYKTEVQSICQVITGGSEIQTLPRFQAPPQEDLLRPLPANSTLVSVDRAQRRAPQHAAG
jgi:hypothetical protein